MYSDVKVPQVKVGSDTCFMSFFSGLFGTRVPSGSHWAAVRLAPGSLSKCKRAWLHCGHATVASGARALPADRPGGSEAAWSHVRGKWAGGEGLNLAPMSIEKATTTHARK